MIVLYKNSNLTYVTKKIFSIYVYISIYMCYYYSIYTYDNMPWIVITSALRFSSYKLHSLLLNL